MASVRVWYGETFSPRILAKILMKKYEKAEMCFYTPKNVVDIIARIIQEQLIKLPFFIPPPNEKYFLLITLYSNLEGQFVDINIEKQENFENQQILHKLT